MARRHGDSEQCDMACTGNNAISCGGKNDNAIYKIDMGMYNNEISDTQCNIFYITSETFFILHRKQSHNVRD